MKIHANRASVSTLPTTIKLLADVHKLGREKNKRIQLTLIRDTCRLHRSEVPKDWSEDPASSQQKLEYPREEMLNLKRF